MTPEQIERTIEFILEHEAQVTVHLAQMTANIERVTAQMEQVSAHQGQVTARMDQVTAQVERVTGQVERVTGQVERVTGQVERVTAQVERVTGQVGQVTAQVGQVTAQTIHLADAFLTEHDQRIKDQARTRDVQSAILILSELTQVQSHRLDRKDEEFSALLKDCKDGQREALEQLSEILRLLRESKPS